MTTHSKIQGRYLSKIALYFDYDWFFLFVSIITVGYFLINYFFKNSFIFSNIPRLTALITGIIFSTFFIIKYFISSKLRARLIIEIIEDSKYYSLIVYNKSVITVDKAIIPLDRQEADYFINNLFSNRMGTIHVYNKQSERFTVKIDNKEYYLVPALFESEVLI
jgi:hypothetical protein